MDDGIVPVESRWKARKGKTETKNCRFLWRKELLSKGCTNHGSVVWLTITEIVSPPPEVGLFSVLVPFDRLFRAFRPKLRFRYSGQTGRGQENANQKKNITNRKWKQYAKRVQDDMQQQLILSEIFQLFQTGLRARETRCTESQGAVLRFQRQ